MATTERDLRGQIEALEAAWAAPSAPGRAPILPPARAHPAAWAHAHPADGPTPIPPHGPTPIPPHGPAPIPLAGPTPTRPAAVSPTRTRRGWAEPVSPSWSLAGGLAWVGLTALALALEAAPAAAGQGAALPALDAALGFVYGALLCATFAGLASGRRLGFGAGALAAGFALLLTAACPLTGHHDWALWQLGRLGTDSALLAISLAGLRRA